ncbi:MAG TPA: multicopper oxidase domain-containing protein [Anaerolineales bacterium]|nr:multicopper oxidase domain-containing protein [Anaerolineales bacterium]
MKGELPITRLFRRDFIKLTGMGAGALTLSACGLVPPASSVPTTSPVISTPFTSAPVFPSFAVDLTAGPATLPILSGAKTSVWRYQASVREGSAESIQTLSGSYLGPIFRIGRGQRVQVRLKNELPDPTIIHWHGLSIPEEMDGHPRYAIAPGASYEYDFQVINRAGMYWFHPHPHGLTGAQVYYGLAGLFIVSDDEEASLGLPAGEYDLPLVIQDRTFDSQNQMVYLANGMMDQMIGLLGDTILVNGAPNAALDVKAGAYRLRLLNGSNSRIYKLAWQDGTPLTVIATDGGLLEAPVTQDYITLAPGERVELWADFSGRTAGSKMRLVSLPFSGFSSGGGMMGGGMMGGSSLPNGASFDILSLKVGAKSAAVVPLPTSLATIVRHRVEDAVNRNHPRSFTLAMQGMIHTINGRVFEMDAVARDEIVRLGDLEIWEFANLEGGQGGMGMGMMNMEMPHPMHIHGVQFQVLGRQVTRGYQSAYRELSAGFVDDGWKDTVLVMPGEKVQVLVRFEKYAGTYLYHCHNLEHGDAGMMRNYKIESQ